MKGQQSNIASTLVWILMQEESSPPENHHVGIGLGSYPPGTSLPTVVSRTPPMHRTHSKKFPGLSGGRPFCIHGYPPYGAFTLDFKSALNENLGGILGGTQC
jgi:hypothetical protein